MQYKTGLISEYSRGKLEFLAKEKGGGGGGGVSLSCTCFREYISKTLCQ